MSANEAYVWEVVSIFSVKVIVLLNMLFILKRILTLLNELGTETCLYL